MNFRLPSPAFQMPDTPSGGGSSAPTSAPASVPSTPSPDPAPSTPSAEPSSSDSASGAGADSSFGFMFDPTNEDPLEGLGLPTTETPTPVTATPEPAPAQPAKPAQASPEPAPQTPSPAPAPTEATSPQPATPSANLDPYDPGALARHLVENEEQAVQYAAENLFKLSPKDVEDLESDVVGTIPRLLARTLVASQRNFLLQLGQLIPTMIQRQGAVTQAHTEAENEFYTRWPDIKKDQHNGLVLQYARVYGQMHPQATRKERIEAVGPMVMMAAKIAPGVVVQPGARPSPMVPSNGRPPQPTPFVPAGPSAGGASPTTQAPLDDAVSILMHQGE